MKCTGCKTEIVGKFYQAERRRYYTPLSKNGVGYESYLPKDKDGNGILLCVPCMDKEVNWGDFEVTPSHIVYDVEDRQGLYLPPKKG